MTSAMWDPELYWSQFRMAPAQFLSESNPMADRQEISGTILTIKISERRTYKRKLGWNKMGRNLTDGTADSTIPVYKIAAEKAIKELEENETDIRFSRLLTICEKFFGKPRVHGSHYIYKVPWAGNPRINLQKDKSKAKVYQVEQVILCLKLLAKKA